MAKSKHAKSSGSRKWTLLGSALAVVAAASIALPSYSAWNTALPKSQPISTSTIPAPGSASGTTGSTTTTSSHAATPNDYCPLMTGYKNTGFVNVDGEGLQCGYTWNYDGTNYYDTPAYEYSCPSGETLSGSTCDTTTTTPHVKLTWATPTGYGANGQPLATGVNIVDGSSCSTSAWTTVATASPSADSYTFNNPSTSEYYAVQTTGPGGWTSPVSGCTLG